MPVLICTRNPLVGLQASMCALCDNPVFGHPAHMAQIEAGKGETICRDCWNDLVEENLDDLQGVESNGPFKEVDLTPPNHRGRRLVVRRGGKA